MRAPGRVVLTMLALVIPMITSTASADVIRLRNGKSLDSVTIVEATYEEVRYKRQGISRAQTQAAAEVLEIEWSVDGLRRARGALERGDYKACVDRCSSRLNDPDARRKANALYLTGLAQVRWGGQESTHYAEAADTFARFVREFGNTKEFYLPHATARLADALIAVAKYGEAEKSLGQLVNGKFGSTWSLYGKLGLAEVKLAQKDFRGARSLFGTLTTDSTVLGDQDLKGKAFLGYARSQLGQEQHAAAIKTVQEKLLTRQGGKPVQLGRYAAGAYIVWGRAQEQLPGDAKENTLWAALRYLHAVHIAAPGSEELAEALYRASQAFQRLGQTGRAQEQKQRLLKQCPSSPWARK